MLDHYSVSVHNNQQVAALPQLDRGSDYESERHRFESYTPHHLRLKLPATGAFLLRKHCMDSNLGRGAGVKKTRSVFSPRASPPAGGRSRCGSAQRMRGILYAAPFEVKSSRQRGLFFYVGTAWIRTSVNGDYFSSTRVRFRVCASVSPWRALSLGDRSG